MSRFFRENDPGRLVHYEGVATARLFGGDPAWEAATDVESRMYTEPKDIRAYLESGPKKPFILCEYMHDMGNSLGGMESYIRLGEEFPQYLGRLYLGLYGPGAVAHRRAGPPDPWLRRRFCGERQTDYNFSANGIVFADGAEKPPCRRCATGMRPRRPAPRTTPPTPRPRRPARRTSRPNTPRERDAAEAAAPDLKLVHGDGALGVQWAELLRAVLLHPRRAGQPAGPRGRMAVPRAAARFLARGHRKRQSLRFPVRSAAWLAADSQTQCTGVTVERESPRAVTVACRFEPPAVPGAFAVLRYYRHGGRHADADGRIPRRARPARAALLRRAAHDARAAGCVGWTGLSGETYPDRYKGGVFGAHSETPHITPYLVPQDTLR